MGRTSDLTYESVAAAADALRAGGSMPSTRSVRDRLGTGSMSTITAHMQRWRNEHREANVELTLPPGLQRALLGFIAEEQAAARAALEAEMANLQQEVADLLADNERMDEQVQEQAAELVRSASLVAALQARERALVDDTEAARKAEHEARTAAEQSRVQLAKAELRIEGLPALQGMLDQARAMVDTERERRVAAEQRAAVLDARLEAAAPAGLSLRDTLQTADRRLRQ